MAVVVNNPGDNHSEASGWGPLNILLTLVFGAIIIYFLIVYAMPAVRQAPAPTGGTIEQNQVAPPAQEENNPDIKIPDEVDININQQPQQGT